MVFLPKKYLSNWSFDKTVLSWGEVGYCCSSMCVYAVFLPKFLTSLSCLLQPQPILCCRQGAGWTIGLQCAVTLFFPVHCGCCRLARGGSLLMNECCEADGMETEMFLTFNQIVMSSFFFCCQWAETCPFLKSCSFFRWCDPKWQLPLLRFPLTWFMESEFQLHATWGTDCMMFHVRCPDKTTALKYHKAAPKRLVRAGGDRSIACRQGEMKKCRSFVL